MNRRRTGSGPLALALSAAWLAATLGGCGGPPQVTGHNREIVTSLVTAVSAKNADWLEKNAKEIDKHKAEGTLSDSEFAAFSDVLAKARAGKWEEAEQAVYALREAQEPTAEDLKNLEQRKLAPEHGVPKKPLGGRKPR